MLDSNDYASLETDYDFILATDAHTVVQSQNQDDLDSLQTHLHSNPDWLFGFLSYDLKNQLENLQSQNLDHLDFPELFFFQPKRLWVIKENRVEAHYLSPYQPNDDWEQIISIPDRYANSIEKEVFMQHRISKADYLAKTYALQQHIARGDIYEVNFCMELYAEDANIEPHTLFQEINEKAKRDKCYYKVKARYDVWPSAYASGALVKCRKVGAKNWGNKSKKESIGESYDIWSDDLKFGYTMEGIVEAEYQGRKVKLGKPMQGDVKKFKVYVKNPQGNVVKVNFGQGGKAKGGTMKIRKSNPNARKNFRARHNCDNPGPRHKARYWSCRKW